MSRLTTKCFNCGKVRSKAYFEMHGAVLQRRWIWWLPFVKVAFVCRKCYENNEETDRIVRRFYNT